MTYIYTVREQIFTAQIEIGDELEITVTLELVNNQSTQNNIIITEIDSFIQNTIQ